MIDRLRYRRAAGSAAYAAAVLAIATGAPAHAQEPTTPTPEPPPPPEPAAPRSAVKAVFGSSAVSFVELRGKDRTWSLASAGAAFNTSATGTTTAEVERSQRPGLANVRGVLRHDEQLAKDTAVYVQASASSGAPLREQWGVGAGVVQRISAQLQLTLDARAARYRTPGPAGQRASFTGLSVNPGVVINPRGTPLELSAQAIILRNDRKQWQVGGMMRALYYTGDRDFLMAGVSRYPENELGRVRQLTSAYAGMRHELGRGIGVRVTAEHARLQGTWTARTLSVGLEKRF